MQISLFLSLIFVKFSVGGIVDLGLKAHVKSEVTLLELQDPELPKSLSYSVNGFGFQGMMILINFHLYVNQQFEFRFW